MVDSKESFLPKYIQIKEYIIEYIRQKEVKEGAALPTENEVASLFRTSRKPVRQAYRILEEEGIIITIRGKGSSLKKIPQEEKTHIICVISPYGIKDIYENIVLGIKNYAKSRNYDIVLLNSNFSPDNEINSINFIKNKNISGILIEPVSGTNIEKSLIVAKKLSELHIPVIAINCIIDQINLPAVLIDDEKYGFLMTEYLISRNHTRIAIIINSGNVAGRHRKNGYLRALKKYNIEMRKEYVISYTENEVIGLRHPSSKYTLKLLHESIPPTAIFYFDDHDAVIGIKTIIGEGLSIPDDISVIGFDNSEDAKLSPIPLTTVAHPKEEMGIKATQLLIDEIENPGSLKNEACYLDMVIIERESVKTL